eukprot:790299-Amorphochlora_amoeboformis.AAC.1
MDTLDVDGDGKISISEFSIAFLNRKVSSQQERMWNIFTSMDLNGDGVLDKEEIYKALSNKLSKQEAEALLTEVRYCPPIDSFTCVTSLSTLAH